MNTAENKDASSLAQYLFHQGTNFKAQEYLGVHRTGEGFYRFRVWAPMADCVYVCGDFTSWDTGAQMKRESDGGVWELTLPQSGSLEGLPYKYRIVGGGKAQLKSDPYALSFEKPPKTASVICTDISYKWTDSLYIARRRGSIGRSRPMNIYELHAGSWARHGVSSPQSEDSPCGEAGDYLSWRELADRLSVYVAEMGFTHIELLPITEHPYDPSWGYQVTGYFAPTARHGSPRDFKYFVDRMHAAGIGVLLDFVPAHFPRDGHGLFEFDGGPLYEYQGADRMEHAGWGTRFFDVGRCEVQSFLISSALFWIEEYHIDGLRVDAVSSMLYLDYDRAAGEWIPNIYGGRENLEAIAFLRKLNTAILSRHPDAVTAAEESGTWPMVTRPIKEGGLGFTHKWNMGFANDMYAYLSSDPYFRSHIHEKLTFPMMYAFDEKYIIPVSHDEVVHGKSSLIEKMYGSYDEKFSLMRTYLSFMYAMPGAKLLFMGTEFAQFREWDCEHSLEWFMTNYPRHGEMREFVGVLCRFYKSSPPLWDNDSDWDGFEWIDTERREDNIVSFIRRDRRGRELICLFHFAPVSADYTFRVKRGGSYEVLLSTDMPEFGGTGRIPSRLVTAKGDGGESELSLTLHGNCAVYLAKAAPSRKKRSRTADLSAICEGENKADAGEKAGGHNTQSKKEKHGRRSNV